MKLFLTSTKSDVCRTFSLAIKNNEVIVSTPDETEMWKLHIEPDDFTAAKRPGLSFCIHVFDAFDGEILTSIYKDARTWMTQEN